MKRISYSCLLLISLLFSRHIGAQVFNFNFNPGVLCYTGPGTYTTLAVQTASSAGASTYNWNVTSPSPSCAATWVVGPGNGSVAAISFPCCGTYTVSHYAFATGNPAPINTAIQFFTLVCPTGAGVTFTGSAGASTGNTICAGTSGTLGATGAATYTWTSQTGTNAPVNLGSGANIIVTPTANSTYTVTGTTGAGCTITGTASVYVTKANITAVASSTALCPGAPLTLSATTSVFNGSGFTTGTGTTGVQWFSPGGTSPFATTLNTSTVAANGAFSVVLSYTGAAGTCTTLSSVNVTTISTVSVNISLSSASVCPGAAVTLSASVAASPQPGSSSYTWTQQVGLSNTTFTGNPVVKNPTTTAFYTVNVNYYGCTGSATAQVGMATLTVNLSSSTPSTCPNRTFALSANGGVNYTFTAFYSNNPSFPSVVGTATVPSGNATVATSASTSQINPCAIYSVNAFAGGCVGSASTQVCLMSLNTQLIPSSFSVCPNTSVTVHTNNGPGTTNNYSLSPNNTTCSTTTGPGGAITSSCVFGTGNMVLPLTFNVLTDSVGCKGSASVVVYKRTLVPALTAQSNSICPGGAVTFTAFGGAGNNYTFTAPFIPSGSTTNVLYSGSSNTVTTVTPTTPAFPYTFTVSADSSGCVGSTVISVGLLALTPTLVPSSPSVCPGKVFTLDAYAGSGASYTFTAGYTTISNIPNTVSSVTVSAPTSSLAFPQTYTVCADSAGCTGCSTLQVGLMSLTPNLTLSASSTSICPGTSFTLTATNSASGAATSFSFLSLPSGTLLPLVSNNQAATTPTAFPSVYQVLADSGGCVGSRTITIQRKYLNSLTLAASPSLICANMPSTLTAGGVGSAPNVSYTIAAISPTGMVYTGTTPTTVVSPSVLTVYGMVADSAGCTTNTLFAPTVTIGIIPGLTLTPSASTPSVCAGLPTTLSVISTGTNVVNYTWTPSGATSFGTLIPGPAPSASAVSMPTMNVTYTISGSDSLGCVGSTSITIGIDPLATLSVGISAPLNTVCPGLTTTLTATCNINPVFFSWSPTLGLSPTNAATVIAQPSLTTVYTATASNGWGCIGTAPYTVIVNAFPNLTITPTSSAVCAGYTSTLTAFGANSFTWTSASFSNAIAQQSISVGPGTYSVIGSNGGGCLDTTVISIGNAPPLNITTSQTSGTTCIENNNPKFSKPVVLTAAGANTYVWFPYNPIHMTYSLGPSTTVRPPATTCYTVTGATAVCSGSAIVCVTVIPQFSMNVVPPLPYMCIGDSLKLSIVNINTLAVGPPSAFTYSWTEASNAPPISITSKFTQTVLVFPQNTTTYSVQVKDARGCASLPKLVTVTVLPKPLTSIAVPTINNVATNTLCYVGLNPGPDDVVLTLTGTNKNTNLQFGVVPTYTWVSPYPVKYNSILTPPNNNAVTISAPLKVPGLVTYSLISGYNGVQGCLRIDTVTVRVIDCRPITNVSFTTTEKLDTICARTCITFINLTDTAAGGTQTVSWNFKGGSPATSNASIQTVCYNLPGKYDVILTASNPYPKNPPNGQSPGSSNNLGVQSYVKVVDIPNVTIFAPGQLRSDTTIRFGTPINVTGSGALFYEWSPNYNITSLTKPNVTLTPYRNTQYILTGRNSQSCYSSDTLNVIVIEDCGEMYVPNAFTPNNDGVNDVLYVRGICLKTLSFMVFNRWGEKVFETSDKDIGWDGTYKGEALNTGVFVFRLEGRTYDGKSYTAKGNVTLIR